jgi:tRNA(fMet)-specific endonuclease VapC
VKVVLADTNVVSILFAPERKLYPQCAAVTSDAQLFISFMTRAELALWPRQNRWGSQRWSELRQHLDPFTTLFPDEDTCELWAEIRSQRHSVGRPIATADAWIAATAVRWGLPLVTTDHRDFEQVTGLTLVPVG